MEEMEYENEEQNNEDMSDESDDSSIDNDLNELFDTEVKKLKDLISLNPTDYDSHVKLIELYENFKNEIKFNELRINELRLAREQMSIVYPLTPKLWLNWLKDEINLMNNNELEIVNLFERSINDYCSIEIWIEYLNFILSILANENIQNSDLNFNKIFQKASSTVGLHPINGYLIWDRYIIYQDALDLFETDKEKQLKKIINLYQTQLKIPHQQIDNTIDKFNNWINETINNCQIDIKKFIDPNILNLIEQPKDDTNQQYKKLKEKFNQLESYEFKLNNEPKLDTYYKYLDYELSQKEPNRIKYLYERAIIDHCLIPDLWIKYINYLQTKLNFYDEKKDVILDDEIFDILNRAIRNVNWSSDIWIEFLRTTEILNKSQDYAKEIFEKSLSSPFASEEDYRKLWQCYLEFKKRKTDFKDEKQIEQLRKNFQTSIEHLEKMFNADPYFTIKVYQAKIEARYCSDLNRSREIWKSILSNYKILGNRQVNYWLEYADQEKTFGNKSSYKNVMFDALKYCPESYELISNQLIKYFREECDNKREIDIMERKIIDIYEKVVKKQLEKQQKYEQEKNPKRKNEIDRRSNNLDSNKKSRNDEHRSTNRNDDRRSTNRSDDRRSTNRNDDHRSTNRNDDRRSTNRNDDRRSTNRNDDQMQSTSRDERSDDKKMAHKFKPDEVNELQTIVVKNLSFKTSENTIRKEFSKFGNINEIRLHTNTGGDSKYCFIEYSTIEETRNAIKNDRKIQIDGREIYISEYGKKQEFKFSTGLERNKLYVSKLPKNIDEENLVNIFKIYDGFKELRLIKPRNKQSKGATCCYVDFETGDQASRALLQTDGTEIDGKKISVEISNPPVKENKNDKILGDGVFKRPLGPRRRF